MTYEILRWRTNSRFESARSHELSDQQDALVTFHSGLPGVIKAHNVRVLKTLEHFNLFTEALPLHFGQFASLKKVQKKKSEKKKILKCTTSGHFPESLNKNNKKNNDWELST